MNKYIIKNCPCFNEGHYNLRLGGECLDLTQDENEYCVGCTNCLLKRIVTTCKEVIEYNVMDLGMSVMASDVLRLLEIEECE